MEHNHEQGLQLDMKLAYEMALERLFAKEKEVVELRALCNQFANEIHNLQHELENTKKGK